MKAFIANSSLFKKLEVKRVFLMNIGYKDNFHWESWNYRELSGVLTQMLTIECFLKTTRIFFHLSKCLFLWLLFRKADGVYYLKPQELPKLYSE